MGSWKSVGFRHATSIARGFLKRWGSLCRSKLDPPHEYFASRVYHPIQINCACLNTVSDDENLILNAVAQCQIGNSEILRFRLDDLAPSSIVNLALPLFEEFANDLIEGGIYMSRERIYVGAGLMVFASSQQPSAIN